jgi:hypothetical protein
MPTFAKFRRNAARIRVESFSAFLNTTTILNTTKRYRSMGSR